MRTILVHVSKQLKKLLMRLVLSASQLQRVNENLQREDGGEVMNSSKIDELFHSTNAH